uniref:Uncharacterized protein n=1 Tax=Panagrellus redivivus TaxID=6233 RepID=A0A7E4VVB2_PANRE
MKALPFEAVKLLTLERRDPFCANRTDDCPQNRMTTTLTAEGDQLLRQHEDKETDSSSQTPPKQPSLNRRLPSFLRSPMLPMDVPSGLYARAELSGGTNPTTGSRDFGWVSLARQKVNPRSGGCYPNRRIIGFAPVYGLLAASRSMTVYGSRSKSFKKSVTITEHKRKNDFCCR